jgi:hypothetical protein
MQAQSGNGVQMIESDLVRVAVVVADADRDQSGARAGDVEQRRAAAGVGAMMADLQHIHRGEHSPPREHRLYRCLRIPGEQSREPATAQQPDHRGIVDVALRQQTGDVGRGRIQERQHGGRVQPHSLTPARRNEASSRLFSGELHEARVGRVLVVAARVQDQADPIPL